MNGGNFMDNFEQFMGNTFGEGGPLHFGGFGLMLPMLILFASVFLIGKLYGGYLKKRYGFRMIFNIPGLLAMACFIVAWGPMDIMRMGEDTDVLLMLLLIGAPAMILYLINSVRKTNIFHAIFSTVFMYIFYALAGYAWILAIGLVAIGIFAVILGKEAVKGGGSAGSFRCPHCGRPTAHEGSCGLCG
jgi:hypothetical protein